MQIRPNLGPSRFIENEDVASRYDRAAGSKPMPRLTNDVMASPTLAPIHERLVRPPTMPHAVRIALARDIEGADTAASARRDIGERPAPAAPAAAVTAAAPTGPTAPRQEILVLELMLRDPAVQAMVSRFGGALQPLPANTGKGGNAVADGLIKRYGADLAARLDQYSRATQGVRDAFLAAMDATARAGSGMGWKTVAISRHIDTESALGQQTITEQVPSFDPALFATEYARGSSVEQRAFAQLYGANAVTVDARYNHWAAESNGQVPDAYVLAGTFDLNVGSWSPSTFEDPRGFTQALTPHWQSSSLSFNRDYNPSAVLDLARLPKLNQADAVGFDPALGWATPGENIHVHTSDFDKFLDKAFPVIAGGFAAWATMGLASSVGGAVASATGSTTLGAAAGAGTSALAAGAAGQLAANGRIDFDQLLKTTLSGALTGGVLNRLGLAPQQLDKLPFAQRLIGLTGAATVQGALQQVLGGRFKDGFTNAIATGLAGELRQVLDSHVAGLKLDAAQQGAFKLLTQATTSAVRALGNPNDPGYAFAQEFLSSMVGDGLQSLRPAPNPATAADHRNGLDVQSDIAHDINGAAQNDAIVARRGRETEGGGDAPPPTAQGPGGAPGPGGAMPPEPPDDPNVQRIIVTGRALPRDAQDNRYELLADGAVVVHRADGAIERIEAQQAQDAGLSTELAAVGALTLPGSGAPGALVVRGLPLLSAAAPWTLAAVGVGGLLSGDTPRPLVVELGAGQRYVQQHGQTGGVILEFDPASGEMLWWQNARGTSDGMGRFQALPEGERHYLDAPISTPVQPRPPQGSPPLPIDWPPDSSTGGYEAAPPAGPTIETLPAAPVLTIEDLIVEQRDSKELGANLEAAGQARPSPGHDPHHILPTKQWPQLDRLRDKFKDWGIELKNAANGVWLPGSEAPGDATGSYHERLHNNDYRDAIDEAFIGITTKEQALEKLAEIKQQLKDGTYPGTRPRP